MALQWSQPRMRQSFHQLSTWYPISQQARSRRQPLHLGLAVAEARASLQETNDDVELSSSATATVVITNAPTNEVDKVSATPAIDLVEENKSLTAICCSIISVKPGPAFLLSHQSLSVEMPCFQFLSKCAMLHSQALDQPHKTF
jgi:hypothetical protein